MPRPEFQFKLVGTEEPYIVNREMVWESIHGKRERLCDMDNDHLVNLFHYLTKRSAIMGMQYLKLDIAMLMVIYCELRERCVHIEEFPEEVPYKNPDGNWEIWDWTCGNRELTEQEIAAHDLEA